jgi:hypothetical protein
MTSTNKSLANSGGRGHPFPASIVRGFCLVGGERVKDAVEVGQASVDAITFEMVRHKLYMVIAEAMDALQNVSSSPSTSEALDMMAWGLPEAIRLHSVRIERPRLANSHERRRGRERSRRCRRRNPDLRPGRFLGFDDGWSFGALGAGGWRPQACVATQTVHRPLNEALITSAGPEESEKGREGAPTREWRAGD